MKNIRNMELTERREAVRTIKTNREIIGDCYSATRSATPADTVNALVERVGFKTAVETVAELVNSISEWDGRISRRIRTWAASIETAATPDELEVCHIYGSSIHSAHVNEIGYAMMEMCQK